MFHNILRELQRQQAQGKKDKNNKKESVCLISNIFKEEFEK